ncbi:hypothetical protein [Clostridium sp. UBA5988]|uniref:hypothetical protein n=1 Tax=Clostridium sp. UBA5988 TaxID=1946369 RepID=UPI003217F020
MKNLKSKYESDKYKHYMFEVNGSEDYWMIQHEINVIRDNYKDKSVHNIEIEDKYGQVVAIMLEVY